MLSNTEQEPTVGDVLDRRFVIERRIASGGFGAVFQCRHVESRLPVAIKLLRSDVAENDEARARFVREGQTLCQLRSPHTVMTFEAAQDERGMLFIVMELLEGRTLRDELDIIGRMSWSRATAVISAVASALDEAHSLGIIHRDLKPANIHLSANGSVKVLDFGMAKLLRNEAALGGKQLTAMGQAVGTIDYMAPEQLAGSECDHRADIYALGVLLFEMLAGRRPFHERKGPVQLLTAVLSEPAPRLSTLHVDVLRPGLDEIVQRCLEPDVAKRFSSVGEFAVALGQISRTSTVDQHRSQHSVPLRETTPPVAPATKTTRGNAPTMNVLALLAALFIFAIAMGALVARYC